MHILYLIAITAEAMSGAMMAMQRRMDRFGLAFVGSVTALGGGTVRDVILGHYPLVWIEQPGYLLVTFGAATLCSWMVRHLAKLRAVFLMVDALGLAAFSIIGSDVAASVSGNAIVIVLSGVITGVCGGMLRDLLCNEVPLVLREELYASVAALTATLYIVMQKVGMPIEIATVAALFAGFATRMLSLKYGWRMKAFDTSVRD
ncbi:trimeric intracellular cation channel family protein [Burkholderia gladioli]|uniref:trimeric intracellular cation channel family protein n=1 Tax=Burkholderia gladioli TaxID=28095 RepID=UPI00163E366F|nr:trimeric intracellular cation channel family protein [Burkholderia gladioli]